RKAYKDPMTKDGQWRIIHPGESVLPGPGGQGAGTPPSPGVPRLPTTRPGTGVGGPGAPGGTQGAIIGVASTSKDKRLKVFNGRTRYDQWLFIAGQPRLLGRDQNQRPNTPGGLPGTGVPGGGVGGPGGGFGAPGGGFGSPGGIGASPTPVPRN